MNDLPALPAGFELEGGFQPSGLPPALPAGFQLETAAPVTATGMAKAAGVGAGEGAIGIAGAIGDLSEMGARGLDRATRYIGGKLGVDVAPRPDQAASFGSEAIKKAVEGVTGDFYKPQNKAEEWAHTAGSYAPLAALGPGGFARKAITNIAAPTIGSETAGALTQGTDAEPVARFIGGALGGLGAGKIAGALDGSAAKAAEKLPSVGDLKEAARTQYSHPEVKAVEIKPQAGVALRDTIRNDLEQSGFREANQKPVFSTVEELSKPAGATLKVADIDSTRKALGTLAKEKDVAGAPTATAAAASRAIDHINDFLPKLKQTDLLAGDAAKANAILGDARGNWGAAKRAELVQTKLGNAQTVAASTYGGGNINNATRQQLRPLLMNNAAKTGGYSPEALAALNTAVKGTPMGNIARSIGKLAPTGPVGVGLHIGSAMGTGGTSLAALPVTLGAKKIGEAMTRSSVNKLDSALRADSPLARLNNPQIMAQLKKSDSPISAALLRAIVAAEARSPLDLSVPRRRAAK